MDRNNNLRFYLYKSKKSYKIHGFLNNTTELITSGLFTENDYRSIHDAIVVYKI